MNQKNKLKTALARRLRIAADWLSPFDQPPPEPNHESLENITAPLAPPFEPDPPAIAPMPLASSFNASLAQAFAELESELRRGGRWRPDWDPYAMRHVYTRLSSPEPDNAPEEATNAVAWFENFLKTLPPLTPMGESAAPVRNTSCAPALRFAEGPSAQAHTVSATSLDLHRRAAAITQTRPELSYAQALLEAAKT